MNLGVLLDVAVSVLAVMALFSLAATAINEFVTDYLLKLRGRTLREAICRLLEQKEGVPGDTAPEKAERFFDDPDVRALMQGARLPSAIEPRRYALTVLKLLGRRDALTAQAEGELREARAAILAALPKGATQAAVEEALEAAAARAGAFRTTLDRQVAALEREFNEAMDRASGWYLRRTRLSLFVIGLVMAVGANVDLLHYADRLMTQASVRDKAAIHAQMLGEGWMRDTEAGLNAPDEQLLPRFLAEQNIQMIVELHGLEVRLGWECRELSFWDAQAFFERGDRFERLRNPIEPLLGLGLGNPIDRLPSWAGGCPAGMSYGLPSLSQIIGWLIIGFGVTLGAQFWFDLFKRAVSLRTAGYVGSARRAEEEKAAPPVRG